MIFLRNCILSFLLIGLISLPAQAIDLSVFAAVDETTINQYQQDLYEGSTLDELIDDYYPELINSSIHERNISKLILVELIFSNDAQNLMFQDDIKKLNEIINYTLDKAMRIHLEDLEEAGINADGHIDEVDHQEIKYAVSYTINIVGDGKVDESDISILDDILEQTSINSTPTPMPTKIIPIEWSIQNDCGTNTLDCNIIIQQ